MARPSPCVAKASNRYAVAPSAIAINGDGCPNGGSEEVAHHELFDAARPIRISDASPNPFRGQTTIEFEVRSGRKPEIAVYDVGGRKIRTLSSGAAEGTVVWDGNSDLGERLASGVYFVRVQQGRDAVTQKVVMLD